MKTGVGDGGFAGGPTNVAVATAIRDVLADPQVSYEPGESSPCTLGTCDHVIAHVSGESLASALGRLLGVPIDAQARATIPDVVLDVLVDQATSVISELRTEIATNGTTARIHMTLSNPGEPLQIGPPPAALTDDMNGGFNGGGAPIGPAESMILDDVGSDVETPVPADPEPSTP
jgi:hypothetical protein